MEANSLATLKILRFTLPHAKARPDVASLIRKLYNGSLSFLGMNTYPIDFAFDSGSKGLSDLGFFNTFDVGATVQLNKYRAVVPVCSFEVLHACIFMVLN